MFKDLLHVIEEIRKRLDIRSIDKGSALQFVSLQYHQPHED